MASVKSGSEGSIQVVQRARCSVCRCTAGRAFLVGAATALRRGKCGVTITVTFCARWNVGRRLWVRFVPREMCVFWVALPRSDKRDEDSYNT